MMLDPCDVEAVEDLRRYETRLADESTSDGGDLTPEEAAAIEEAGRMIAAELHDGTDIGVREVSTGPAVALDTMAPPTMLDALEPDPTLPSVDLPTVDLASLDAIPVVVQSVPALAPAAAPPNATPVRIRRVRLNATHRGASGHYYGPGAPVWEWTHPGATPSDPRRFVRAHDVDAAVRAVQAEHPVASVEIMPDV